jgi:hypothetical protein
MHEHLQQPYQPKAHIFIFLAGVILPVLSITLEATTHICAEQFFDPIPTVWHLLIVIFVPLAQLQGWFAIRRAAHDRLMLAGLANTVVIGISVFYSIVYLPLLPLGALMLIVGLGILPLTPMFSLLASVLIRRRLKLISATSSQKSFATGDGALVVGLIVTAAVIASVELPATLTRIGLQKAVAASEPNGEGIRFLRKYGNKEALLRSCYNRTGWATDLIGYTLSIQNPVTPDEARRIYYRVTGETFDTSAPPRRIGGRLLPVDEFDFDFDQGGENAGTKLKGLSLANSQLDGSVDADGGVGYLQWTLVFQNQSELEREARAEVQLPPGGVVSRLTLWVDGEEREAAFAGRSQARNAYQQVAIRQRRDPVLVTTSGRDKVLVQCFPVLPHKEMKIRVGVTVPLILEDWNHARLMLPHFASRNFRIPDDLKHSVWIESKNRMEGWTRELSQSGERAFVFRETLRDIDLSGPLMSIRIERENFFEMWSKDPFDSKFVVRQSIVERTPSHLRRIVIVLDTSEAMRDAVFEIQAALRSLPENFDVSLLLADNGSSTTENNPVLWPGAASWLLNEPIFAGGADNLPALIKAWDLAAEAPGNNAIVWIHSPQHLLLDPVEPLRQRWERGPYGPTLYSIQTTVGADEIEKKLDGINEVKSVARRDYLRTDIENLFAQLTGRRPALEFVRSSKKMDDRLYLSGVQTSDHLARLWANDEVRRILSSHDQSLNDAATALAARYQLVTPVSGAVVLETDVQYSANGLKPVEAGTVPTIPEPEIVALLLVASLFLVWLYIQRRRASRGTI